MKLDGSLSVWVDAAMQGSYVSLRSTCLASMRLWKSDFERDGTRMDKG